MILEIELPEGLDIDHCYEVVDAALNYSDNVTAKEHLFVTHVMNKIADVLRQNNGQ